MRVRCALWLLVLLFILSCAHSRDRNDGPPRAFNPLKALVDFYQGPLNHCSAVRYGECAMYPSCSEYSKQAFQKYGFFMGTMIASDRLMRCGRDELKTAPPVFVNGKWKYYDPLGDNTAWWDAE